MQAIYNDLRSCTAVVVGSPVYMYSPTSFIKAFTDRLFAFIGPGFVSRLGSGVPLLTIYTQGADDPALFLSSFDSFEGALDMAGLHPAGRILGEGLGEPEELDSRPELMERAFEAGRRLVSG
jgi:multimeric flavodoxin WrbA